MVDENQISSAALRKREPQPLSDPAAQADQLASAMEAFAPERPSQAEEMESDRKAIARAQADQPYIEQTVLASDERVERSKALLQATEPVGDPSIQDKNFMGLVSEPERDESKGSLDNSLRVVTEPEGERGNQKTPPRK